MQLITTRAARSVIRVPVCVLRTSKRYANTAEPTEMPFRVQTQ